MTLPDRSDPLDRHWIDLWLLDIRLFGPDHFREAKAMLSMSEQTRAQKIIRGKNEFLASRWLMRKTLAHYTTSTPEQLCFAHTDKGKPYLPHSAIRFSLSHSGPWAILAVGYQDYLGVDIEARPSKRDLLNIAQQFFHPKEYRHLEALEELDRAQYFYQLWTLKEAFFKALGTGISAGLEKIHFTWQSEHIRASLSPLLAEPGVSLSPEDWQFFYTSQIPEAHCALAYPAPTPAQIRWFDALELL